MTERDPDPLYDALRKRLADYGQEPPAQLWAGIRAKLPPPVAQPQLRRRRRWSPALLLCLLLTVAGAAGWHWWRTAGSGSTAPTVAQTSTANKAAANAAANMGASAGPASSQATASPAQAGAASIERSGFEANQHATASATLSADAASGAVAATQAEEGSARSLRRKRSGSRTAAAALAGNTGARRASASQNRPTDVAVQTRARRESLPAGEERAGAAALRTPTAAASPVGAATLASGTTPGDVTSAAGTADALATKASAASGASTLAATPANASDMASTEQVAPKTVALASLPYPEPVVMARPDTTRFMPVVVARRWAALVLAGPAVTYRKLGNNSFNDSAPFPTPNTAAPNAYTYNSRSANQVATKETADVGFGVQVQVRRQLSGRWGLGTGLGYQEYATQTTVAALSNADFNNTPTGVGSSAPPPPLPPITPVETKHRDTYRFITVPVRLSYALGHPAGRFRYGLLAGLDAALYVGGSSPAANGQVKTWSTADGTYHPLNASFSAGLDLRYRLFPRWDVVAQPTATYFLNSLPRPISGLTPRYLLGTGVQFGVSYDFR
ncbi:MAG TPA: hypothetical protein VF629_08115 [Hymenobacter sp.]|jgi:hypothetical protein|uniref:hypothetical protein n=1 Tax=Hymenobacter sp. TaxID=1898978 RepID=UPI002ED9D212